MSLKKSKPGPIVQLHIYMRDTVLRPASRQDQVSFEHKLEKAPSRFQHPPDGGFRSGNNA